MLRFALGCSLWLMGTTCFEPITHACTDEFTSLLQVNARRMSKQDPDANHVLQSNGQPQHLEDCWSADQALKFKLPPDHQALISMTSDHQEVANYHQRYRKKAGVSDWQLTSVKYANLGGLGPDHDAPRGIRYGDVTKVVVNTEPRTVDLMITTTGKYVPCMAYRSGMHGSFGTVNLANGENVNLVFTFIDAITDEPIAMPGFHFSFFDLDQGKEDEAQEFLITSGYSKVHLMEPSSVKQRTLPDGRTEFKSSKQGGFKTNPTDPTSLTQSQAEQSIQLEFPPGASSVEVELQITNGRRGRNFMFAGMSSLAFCNVDASILDISMSSLVSSNLGNKGPDFDKPEGLRFNQIMKNNGKPVDLIVHALNEYKPQNISQNRLNGQFVQINIARSQEVDLKFRFVDSETSEDVMINYMYFSMFDIDEGRFNHLEETMKIGGFAASYLTDTTEVIETVLADGRNQYVSSTHGIIEDNPKDPKKLTEQQADRAVTFLFTKFSSFETTFASSELGPLSGRNFLVAGKSSNVFC